MRGSKGVGNWEVEGPRGGKGGRDALANFDGDVVELPRRKSR